jgi:hypothetical protein
MLLMFWGQLTKLLVVAVVLAVEMFATPFRAAVKVSVATSVSAPA